MGGRSQGLMWKVGCTCGEAQWCILSSWFVDRVMGGSGKRFLLQVVSEGYACGGAELGFVMGEGVYGRLLV